MNNRIEELIVQSTDASGLNANLFAELIISDCIEAVNNTSHTDVYTTYDLSLVKSTIVKSIESIRNKFRNKFGD